MKKTLSYFLYTMLIACIVCACNDGLDIIQDYEYSVETLPLPKKLKQGETVDLEFSIVREGFYTGTSYKFRYFQSEGEGLLSYKGKIVPVNRFQYIDADNFVLEYEAKCSGQQVLDFVFEDSSGKKVEYSIAFAGGKTEKEQDLPVYTFYPMLTDSLIMEITGFDESAVERDRHGNICRFWLYSDATNPMNQRGTDNPFWKTYWEKLEILAKLTLMR